jgi:hypothetical protein
MVQLVIGGRYTCYVLVSGALINPLDSPGFAMLGMNSQLLLSWILHINKSAEIITSRLDIFSRQQIRRYSHIAWPAIDDLRDEIQAF